MKVAQIRQPNADAAFGPTKEERVKLQGHPLWSAAATTPLWL
jgi:hypothetical protein